MSVCRSVSSIDCSWCAGSSNRISSFIIHRQQSVAIFERVSPPPYIRALFRRLFSLSAGGGLSGRGKRRVATPNLRWKVQVFSSSSRALSLKSTTRSAASQSLAASLSSCRSTCRPLAQAILAFRPRTNKRSASDAFASAPPRATLPRNPRSAKFVPELHSSPVPSGS